MKRCLLARTSLVIAPLLLLCSCSSSPEPAKPVASAEANKPAEPVTGLTALYKMYTSARAWAQDLQVVSLRNLHLDQVKDQPGKTGAWQATFASPSLGKSRTYTYAVIEASMTMHEGVTPDTPRDWTNSGNSFLVGAAKIDSDKAWDVALQHAKEYAAKHPDQQIAYTLQMEHGIADPQWRVIWGTSATVSSFSVLVNATTGAYTTTLH